MDNVFERIIKTDEIKFKYAKGMRDIIGDEIHSYHEIFFFVEGDATFISEYGSHHLEKFTTVIIPKETFHCFKIVGDDSSYCRCVFNFDSVSELDMLIKDRMNRIFLTQNDEITNIFFSLENLSQHPMQPYETEAFLKALFAQLLVRLKKENEYLLDKHISPITQKALKYIEKHISQNLSISKIADEIYTSASYLSHVFKNDMNISIHKYILEKRLILARSMLKNNEKSTAVALQCGFNDYSGFYREYKKKFGAPPSKTNKR